MKHFKDTYKAWRLFLSSGKHIMLSVAISAFALTVLMSFSNFLVFNQTRVGSQINDPILNSFSAIDLTIPLFILIYGLTIAAILNLMKYPLQFVFGFLAYATLLSFRLITIYLLPLEPPAGVIQLIDPVTALFAQGTPLTKDLFFSGHTATSFLFFLLVKGKTMKVVAFSFFVLIGTFVVLQHVHYTVDVVVAPFIAYASFQIASFFKKKFLKTSIKS